MRILFVIFLTVFSFSTVFGTAQYSDIIIYNGKKYSLETNPLESYFEKYPDKRPKDRYGVEVGSTALWRGYVATFEIKDNQLYLRDIQKEVATDSSGINTIEVNVLTEVFPNQELVKVDWFTGLLVLPEGKVINYVHMGYASTSERYILLEIDEGNLKKERHFDYKEYSELREKQFQAFKKTEEYEKMKAEIKNMYNDDDFIESFLRVYVIDYTSKILVESDAHMVNDYFKGIYKRKTGLIKKK